MSIPLVKGTPTPAVMWTCLHAGTWYVTGSGTAEEGGKKLTVFGDSIVPIAPCLGIPPSGIPPCTFPVGIIGTAAFKIEGSAPYMYVKVLDLQFSVTGFPLPPAVPAFQTTKVKTI